MAQITVPAPNGTYTNVKGEFLNSIINKIGRQEYTDQAFVNPLKRFKGGFIDCASDIEEIYVAKAEDTGFDKEGKTVMDRTKPMVFAQYHTTTVEHGYKQTTSFKAIRKAFADKGGVTKMAHHIIQSIHTGSEVDEYNDIIQVLKALAKSKVGTNTISIAKVVDEVTSKRFCKEVKKVIPKMSEWNSNYSKRPNYAKASRLVLFIDSDVDVEISVESLASAFNMSHIDLNNTTKIVVPNLLTKLGDKQFAILCDERCLKINPSFYDISPTPNNRGKFVNHDLVVELLTSYSDWFQFVVFTEALTKAEQEKIPPTFVDDSIPLDI